MSKIKLSEADIEAYGIRNQDDLDRLQKIMSDRLQEVVEFEPLDNPVSTDVQNYINQKFGTQEQKPSSNTMSSGSSITPDDIKEFLKNKK